MVSSEPIPFAVGDVVRLKKPHPCGGLEWRVVRLGADIGVKCVTCGRRVLLPRRELLQGGGQPAGTLSTGEDVS